MQLISQGVARPSAPPVSTKPLRKTVNKQRRKDGPVTRILEVDNSPAHKTDDGPRVLTTDGHTHNEPPQRGTKESNVPTCPICGREFSGSVQSTAVNRHIDRCLRQSRHTERKRPAESSADDDSDPTVRRSGGNSRSPSRRSHKKPRSERRGALAASSLAARPSKSGSHIADDWSDVKFRKRNEQWNQDNMYVQSLDQEDDADVEFDGGLVVPFSLWNRLYDYQRLALK